MCFYTLSLEKTSLSDPFMTGKGKWSGLRLNMATQRYVCEDTKKNLDSFFLSLGKLSVVTPSFSMSYQLTSGRKKLLNAPKHHALLCIFYLLCFSK